MKLFELENKLKAHATTVKNRMSTPIEWKTEVGNQEDSSMKNTKNKMRLSKTLAIAAVLVFCIVTATITPIATPLKGLFQDIIRIDGAVTGTKYINANNEIQMEIVDILTENGNDVVLLNFTFMSKTQVPFSEIQEIAIPEYRIFDGNHNEVIKSKIGIWKAPKGGVNDGKIFVSIPIEETLNQNGTYFILIEKMYGLKKADAPLQITGNWECEFKK